MRSPVTRLAAATLLVAALAACTAAGAPSSSPSVPPTTPPSPTPPAGVIVTIRVVDAETFRVRLTEPADIAIARDLLAGKEAPSIPNGKVVRGDPDVNTGYSWHLDPNDFEWADVTIEVCDGRPSDVEKNVITSDRYCTWAAKVIAVDPA